MCAKIIDLKEDSSPFSPANRSNMDRPPRLSDIRAATTHSEGRGHGSRIKYRAYKLRSRVSGSSATDQFQVVRPIRLQYFNKTVIRVQRLGPEILKHCPCEQVICSITCKDPRIGCGTASHPSESIVAQFINIPGSSTMA